MARKPSPSSESTLARQIVWVALVAAWVFVVLSLLGFDPQDPPTHAAYPTHEQVRNWCGPVGATIAYHTFRLLGFGAWVLLAGMGIGFVALAMGRRVDLLILRFVGVIMSALAFSGLNAMLVPHSGPMNLAGGTSGQVLAGELVARFGTVGGSLTLVVMLMIGLLVAFDRYLLLPVRWLWGRLVPATGQAISATVRQTDRAMRSTSGGLVGALARMVRHKKPVQVRLDDIEDDEELQKARPADPAKKKTRQRPAPRTSEHEPAPSSTGAPRKAAEGDEDDDDLPGAPQVYSEEDLREKMARLPIRFGQKNKRVATEADLEDLQNVQELEGYRFPPLDLLEDPEENFEERLEQVVREQAEALVAALQQYKIDGEVEGVESGPVITLYHVRLAPGTRVSQLESVSKDIARALKAVNIRIVANQAGRDTVGIEVPNPTKEKVRLKELMSSSEAFNKMRLPLFLGKDASGEPLIADLTTMPHMLIAGTTGSGKSVCMNTIIMGFLFTKKPNELKLVLVDPKMVEMSQFKSIPHLMCPVVTEMSRAAAILEWAVAKMDERYELLAEAGCRDIAAYNAMSFEELKEAFQPRTEQEEARIPRKLPYMVFIIDELADLMMTNKEVEGSIIRIAQKARAVGIHLILATQRPQANVVTGLIKSNMPCRVAFKVASGMDSRIVLDQKGGELLLGQGDMLYLSPSSHKLIRAQGTLVDDREIRRVVRFMRDVAAPSFERQLTQIRSLSPDEERLIESENNSSASLAAAQEDPLFDRAVEIVLETRRGSVSLLQRRLAIGYTRASRLIDLMGIAGIIGEHKGSVAREVLITPEQWEQMKRLAEEEAAGENGDAGQGELFASGSPSKDDAMNADDTDSRSQTLPADDQPGDTQGVDLAEPTDASEEDPEEEIWEETFDDEDEEDEDWDEFDEEEAEEDEDDDEPLEDDDLDGDDADDDEIDEDEIDEEWDEDDLGEIEDEEDAIDDAPRANSTRST